MYLLSATSYQIFLWQIVSDTLFDIWPQYIYTLHFTVHSWMAYLFSLNGSQMFRENWFTTYLLSVISYQISKTNFLLHLYLIFYISLKVRNLNFIIFYNTYLWENKLVSGVWTTVKMGFLSIYYLLSDRPNQRVVTISVNQIMVLLCHSILRGF